MFSTGFLFVFVWIPPFTLSDNLQRCYQCLGEHSFSSCIVQTCSSTNYHCYYEEVWAQSGFRILGGCTSDRICNPLGGQVLRYNRPDRKYCKKCCEGDLCNTPLCSTSGPVQQYTTHKPVTIPPVGPHCFSCDGAASMIRCNEMSACKYGEHCTMEAYDIGGNQMRYYGGCAVADICTAHSFPSRTGHRVCSACCTDDFCNSDVCGTQVKAYTAVLSPGEGKRHCYQCYDQKLEEVNNCYKAVECAHSSSQCTQVLRNESGIATVDMDCEENLPCTSSVGTDHDVCDICCNWDFCNREVDCRYPVTMTTSHTTLPTPGITSSISQSTTTSTPRQCYKCSDLRVHSTGNVQLCYNIVTCSKPTSKCSAVYVEENGITTVDMGCEEELPCNPHHTSPDTCSSCCDRDLCNQDLDCRPQKSTVTTPTSPRNHTGVECEVCSGATCGVDSARAVSVKCNDNTTPYCLNTVLNDVNGDKHVTKRCGSVSECESKWLKRSSLLSACVTFDPSSIYSDAFECTYCCVTHNCNRNIRPQNVTLFNPKTYIP